MLQDDFDNAVFYDGPPTVAPAAGEDDWFASAQMGKAERHPNNDLRGDEERGTEVE